MPAWSVLGAQLIVGLTMAALGSALLLAAGTLAYDAALPVLVVSTLLGFTLAAVGFIALGLLLGSLLSSARPHRRWG